jgi:hypothetical protein
VLDALEFAHDSEPPIDNDGDPEVSPDDGEIVQDSEPPIDNDDEPEVIPDDGGIVQDDDPFGDDDDPFPAETAEEENGGESKEDADEIPEDTPESPTKIDEPQDSEPVQTHDTGKADSPFKAASRDETAIDDHPEPEHQTAENPAAPEPKPEKQSVDHANDKQVAEPNDQAKEETQPSDSISTPSATVSPIDTVRAEVVPDNRSHRAQPTRKSPETPESPAGEDIKNRADEEEVIPPETIQERSVPDLPPPVEDEPAPTEKSAPTKPRKTRADTHTSPDKSSLYQARPQSPPRAPLFAETRADPTNSSSPPQLRHSRSKTPSPTKSWSNSGDLMP